MLGFWGRSRQLLFHAQADDARNCIGEIVQCFLPRLALREAARQLGTLGHPATIKIILAHAEGEFPGRMAIITLRLKPSQYAPHP